MGSNPSMNPISSKISWKYQRHADIIDSVFFRNSPDFVFQSDPSPIEGEIPVFFFHDVYPERFEEQCVHLARNGYRTISGEELLYVLRSKKTNVKNTVVLTFDDGLKSVWTIAYPLLKKFGLNAICFLNPGCIPADDHEVRPTLEDCWNGHASLEEIVSKNRADSPLANWREIQAMHESGAVDFQSHTMYHNLVFISNDVFDFYSPTYKASLYGVLNLYVPTYRRNGKDIVSRDPLMGMPIYRSKPRMAAERRYFDDESIRNRCIDFVEREGGGGSFLKRRIGAGSFDGWFRTAGMEASLTNDTKPQRNEINPFSTIC